MSIFTNLWSWSFAVGLVLGFVANRVYVLAHTVYLDRTDPLPGGCKRSKWRAVAIDPRFVVGLIAVAFLGWSITTQSRQADEVRQLAQENVRISLEAKAFADRVQKCNAALIAAVQGSRAVTSDNDRLSAEERRLLADGQRLTVNFAGQLLEEVSPTEQRTRIRQFFQRLVANQALIDAKEREQTENEARRPALPDPDCGS